MGSKNVRFLHYIKIDVLFHHVHLPYQHDQPRRLTLEFRNNCKKNNCPFLYTPCICIYIYIFHKNIFHVHGVELVMPEPVIKDSVN